MMNLIIDFEKIYILLLLASMADTLSLICYLCYTLHFYRFADHIIWPMYFTPFAIPAWFCQWTRYSWQIGAIIRPANDKLVTRHQLSTKTSLVLVIFIVLNTQNMKKNGTQIPGPFATRWVVPRKCFIAK